MSDHWHWLAVWLGTACVAAGFAVIAVLFVGSGEQATSVTQLPYVLVSGGGGVGAVVFGAALFNSQRRRVEQRQVEEAAARMLRAAAHLTRARTGDAGPVPGQARRGPRAADQGGRT